MFAVPFWTHDSWHVISQLHVVLATQASTDILHPWNVPESGTNLPFPLR